MIRIQRKPWLLSAVFVLSLAGGALAQGPMGGTRGPFGDWLLSIDFEGRPMEAILTMSRGAEGARTGQWISFFGVNDLSDVEFENGELKFKWTMEGFDGQTRTSSFAGRIEEGSLTGTLSGERGDRAVTGKRMPMMPMTAGNWELKYRIGERDMTSVLKVTADAERNLAGEWVSEWGEHRITDLSADRNQLTFKRTTKLGDRELESLFTGTIQRNELSGTMTSEMGETAVTGTRLGANAIGTWMLDVESEWGTQKQRLLVNRDLSARYGTLAVDKVTVDGNQLSFPMRLEFGDQPFEMTFKGTIDGNALTGQLTSSRGDSKVTGARVVRPARVRPGQ